MRLAAVGGLSRGMVMCDGASVVGLEHEGARGVAMQAQLQFPPHKALPPHEMRCEVRHEMRCNCAR